MPDLVVGFAQADTRRQISDAVWKGCQFTEIQAEKKGVYWDDDFTTGSAALTNAALSFYKITGTGGTGVLLSTDDGGVLSLRSGAVANNESYLAGGQGLAAFQQFLVNTPNQMWFEARVRPTDITTGGFFVGLAKPTDIAAGFLVNTTNVLASTVNAVGFNVKTATPNKLDIVYAKAGAPTTLLAGAATPTNTTTWFKLGLRFEAQNGKNIVRFYVNGAEVANVVASAANFPSAVPMTLCLGSKSGAGAEAKNLDVDWVRYAGVIGDSTYG